MASVNLLGKSRRRRKRKGLRGAGCGPGWRLNKKRTKCIRKRKKTRR